MITDEKRTELSKLPKKVLVERVYYAEELWILSVKKRDALEAQLSAYENDLVLLDVSDKLKKAEARIAELETYIVEHNQKMIDIGTNRFGRGK